MDPGAVFFSIVGIIILLGVVVAIVNYFRNASQPELARPARDLSQPELARPSRVSGQYSLHDLDEWKITVIARILNSAVESSISNIGISTSVLRQILNLITDVLQIFEALFDELNLCMTEIENLSEESFDKITKELNKSFSADNLQNALDSAGLQYERMVDLRDTIDNMQPSLDYDWVFLLRRIIKGRSDALNAVDHIIRKTNFVLKSPYNEQSIHDIKRLASRMAPEMLELRRELRSLKNRIFGLSGETGLTELLDPGGGNLAQSPLYVDNRGSIKTDGGTYIAGDINTEGGSFVGRDRYEWRIFFEVQQQAYLLWLKLVMAADGHSGISEITTECQAWFSEHQLSLIPEVRSAFHNACEAASLLPIHLDSTENLEQFKQLLEIIKQCGRIIRDAR